MHVKCFSVKVLEIDPLKESSFSAPFLEICPKDFILKRPHTEPGMWEVFNKSELNGRTKATGTIQMLTTAKEPVQTSPTTGEYGLSAP